VQDHFTGFLWGESFSNKTAANLAGLILRITVNAGFGSAGIILTDNGRDVTNKLMDGMKFSYNISLYYI
jgi:hypothetical protein